MITPGSALSDDAPTAPEPSPTSPVGAPPSSTAGGTPVDSPWEPDLLAADPAGLAEVARLVTEVTREAATALRARTGPLPRTSPAELSRRVDRQLPDGVVPRQGRGRRAVLDLARAYAEGTVDLADPRAAAHLQPPPLTVAAAVDVLASAFNASVDTWDSGPYAVELERRLIRDLTQLTGYGPRAGGVLTPGGSSSNLQALLIARDAALRDRRRVRATGLTGLELRPVVYCSELAHFSVARACAVLGLGEDAVRPVRTDGDHQISPRALEEALSGRAPQECPLAVVATAGTTDYGSVDPLRAVAGVARKHGVRMHVDAAYGCGALFSERLRPLLDGVELADSVTLDLHKTAWQPAATSALLVRDAADLDTSTGRRVAYLNPDDDGAAGYDGLLGLSLQTTRRADALKVAATFLALGRDGVGTLLERCHELARHATRAIEEHPRLELTAGATLTTVVFRYLPDPARWEGSRATGRDGAARAAHSDTVNAALRRRLIREARALVGRTELLRPAAPAGAGTVRLRLTLLNPQARTSDIDDLLAAVAAAGAAVEREGEHRGGPPTRHCPTDRKEHPHG